MGWFWGTSEKKEKKAPSFGVNKSLVERSLISYRGFSELTYNLNGFNDLSQVKIMVKKAGYGLDWIILKGDYGPMHYIARGAGSFEIYKYFVKQYQKAGINPYELKDYDDRLPVMMAATRLNDGNLKIFFDLIEKTNITKENINTIKTKSGRTLAHAICMNFFFNLTWYPFATLKNVEEGVAKLVELGADFTQEDKFGYRPVDYLAFYHPYWEQYLKNIIDPDNKIPAKVIAPRNQWLAPSFSGDLNYLTYTISNAILAGTDPVPKLNALLEDGTLTPADLLGTGINGFNVLHNVIWSFADTEHKDLVKKSTLQFLKSKADECKLDIFVPGGDTQATPLHVAAANLDLKTIQNLIYVFELKEDDLLKLDANGRNFAHAFYLCQLRNPQDITTSNNFTQFIKRYPSLLEQKDKYGLTPCDYQAAVQPGCDSSKVPSQELQELVGSRASDAEPPKDFLTQFANRKPYETRTPRLQDDQGIKSSSARNRG